MVVCDKGYTDFAWYQALMDQGVFFVTRARANASLKVLSEAEPQHGNVLFDQMVRMTGVKPRAIGLRPLRRVGWRDPKTDKEYVYLTNARHLAARTIAEVYKARWRIELFFKWLKQNLRIKAFLGTSRNAVLTQIWVAMCVYLMLAYLKFISRTGRSLQEILRLLHLNLFHRRNLAALLAGQGRDPVPKWQQNQLVLL
jgi:putative transposase